MLRTVILVLTVTATCCGQPSEPTHDGLDLSIWVKNLRSDHEHVRQRAFDAVMTIGPAARPSLDSIVKALQSFDESNGMERAVVAALRIEPAKAGPAVFDLFKFHRANRSTVSPQFLREHGEKICPHIAALLKNTDAALRVDAIRALRELGSAAADAVPDLAASLETAPLAVRVEAFRAIEQIAPERLPGLLEPLIRIASERGISASRFHDLFENDAERVLARLARQLAAEQETHRLELARMMAEFGMRSIPLLSRHLDHSNAEVRLACATALRNAAFSAGAASPALSARLHDSDARVRLQCAGALFSSDSSLVRIVVPVLAVLVNHEDPLVRADAVEQLSELGKSAGPAAPALIRRLDDRDRSVRLKCASTLLKIDPAHAPVVVPALQRSFREGGSWGRRSADFHLALSLVETIGPPALPVLPWLVKYFTLESRNLRFASVTTALRVSRIIAGQALPVLREALQQRYDSGNYQSQAIRELGQLGSAARAALPDLLELLQTESDPSLQLEAACAAILIDPNESAPAVRHVRDGLKQPDRREQTLSQLGQLGPRASLFLPQLMQLLRDTEFPEPERIVRIVASIGPEAQAVAEDLHAVARERAALRQRIAEALEQIAPRHQ